VFENLQVSWLKRGRIFEAKSEGDQTRCERSTSARVAPHERTWLPGREAKSRRPKVVVNGVVESRRWAFAAAGIAKRRNIRNQKQEKGPGPFAAQQSGRAKRAYGKKGTAFFAGKGTSGRVNIAHPRGKQVQGSAAARRVMKAQKCGVFQGLASEMLHGARSYRAGFCIAAAGLLPEIAHYDCQIVLLYNRPFTHRRQNFVRRFGSAHDRGF
jgi:hypothetical protein